MQLEPTKLATPSMSNGTMRHHNTIENIIIVRRGREQRLSRVRWRFQPALLLTKRVLARVAHVEEVVLVPDHAQKQIQSAPMRCIVWLRMGVYAYLCSSYIALISAAVGGRVSSTKMKM